MTKMTNENCVVWICKNGINPPIFVLMALKGVKIKTCLLKSVFFFFFLLKSGIFASGFLTKTPNNLNLLTMDEEKLQFAGLKVWYELNSQLRKAGLEKLSCYEYVIFHLLDSTLRMFSDRDNQKRIKEYERILNRWNDFVEYLKKTYEN